MPKKARASIMGLAAFQGFGGGEKENKRDVQKRLKIALKAPTNQFCSDCSLPEPSWVCLLENPVDRNEFRLAAVCCKDCASSFHDLGADVCQLKSTTDEFTSDEVKALEYTGNAVVKSIYEAKLNPEDMDDERRKKGFIRHKYQTLKFFSKKSYEDRHAEILEKEAKVEEEDNDEDKRKTEKERKRAEKKAQKEADRKAKEEKRKAKKKKSKDDGANEESLHGSFGQLDISLDENESFREGDANGSNSQLLGNSNSLLNYNVKSLGEEGEEEQPDEINFEPVQQERPRQQGGMRRRRSGRGLQQLTGGDGGPVSAQSDHAPMMRRGRSTRGGTGASSRNFDQTGGSRQATSHSPVPGRVNRPSGRSGGRPNDPLSSQSDHVSTTRRKRGGRLKDIHWDPSHVPEEVLMASRIINASSIATAQESMAAAFEKFGFEDIDYDTFQDRVAPANQSAAALPTFQESEEPDTTIPDNSNPDFSDPDLTSDADLMSDPDLGSEDDFADEDGVQYADDGYAQGEYAAEGYAQGEYAAEGYVQGEYAAEGYAQGEYAADGYAQTEYAADGYAQGEYAVDGYAQGEYTADSYAQEQPLEQAPAKSSSRRSGKSKSKRNSPMRKREEGEGGELKRLDSTGERKKRSTKDGKPRRKKSEQGSEVKRTSNRRRRASEAGEEGVEGKGEEGGEGRRRREKRTDGKRREKRASGSRSRSKINGSAAQGLSYDEGGDEDVQYQDPENMNVMAVAG